MTIIGLKELRQNASEIADRAKAGERFTVVRRSKPVFTISPPVESSDLESADQWVANYIKKNKPLLDSLAKK